MKAKAISGVMIAIALATTIGVTPILLQLQSAYAVISSDAYIVKTPIAVSGNNVYVAWNNHDTGHWGVFFAKSIDGGKTLGKTIMLSAPNKGNVVHLNVDIAASGSNVLVTWWNNKTGILMPVFKASNDNGDTFGKTIMLNSTSSP